MRVHKVAPTLKVGDKVSTMNHLTRMKMRGIIVSRTIRKGGIGNE